MKAVHFGAGNIGRGFIGALLSQAGYETIFVDVNGELINELNQKRSYQVDLAGTDRSLEVTNVSGLNSINDEQAVIKAIEEAEIITTAVGPNILSVIAPVLAKGLLHKKEKGNVIACENMVGGSEILKNHILEHADAEEKDWIIENIGFPNSAVDRIVPDQHQEDLLTVKVEPYFEWVVETTAIKGGRPEIKGITYVDDLTPYIERKLFTVNTGHAVAAYLGKFHGYQTIKQVMDDPAIKEKIRGALQESGAVLIEKYKFDEEVHYEYIETILSRFENPDLSDEVTRVGRAPIRKLGPNDRLVQPAVSYLEYVKEDPVRLAEVIAAALFYENEKDEEAVELQKLITEKGRINAFKEVAELDSDHRLVKAVEAQVHHLEK
ncbi:mannitol-1-phosphate 5-dehydrogenase [Halobacillus halophilus]|uniref:Mannitol-1-phosphate 5-dehydrogenase n=1 Tax=Halobacillus halophilus (strain ATCC 35676 / DSM 2266 / JCM 20832 / KCTC 3685 / LMG 17431 / NBRC 102448 / NCIMB 2269) TaxID=866895 RepID=I0JJD2_HALH3|nr:mannitol-1-phosphate 5-dehydrogenase [Halobacillus halophilus]ASF38406.1 mannitol-1-phosphate 5-dehydrogenase [Halobacillus halophilus]CCG44250.1 mannitol-1-phosphate 5-dehydrogenase [Halobacillus halophilus DSM 2266]